MRPSRKHTKRRRAVRGLHANILPGLQRDGGGGVATTGGRCGAALLASGERRHHHTLTTPADARPPCRRTRHLANSVQAAATAEKVKKEVAADACPGTRRTCRSETSRSSVADPSVDHVPGRRKAPSFRKPQSISACTTHRCRPSGQRPNCLRVFGGGSILGLSGPHFPKWCVASDLSLNRCGLLADVRCLGGSPWAMMSQPEGGYRALGPPPHPDLSVLHAPGLDNFESGGRVRVEVPGHEGVGVLGPLLNRGARGQEPPTLTMSTAPQSPPRNRDHKQRGVGRPCVWAYLTWVV